MRYRVTSCEKISPPQTAQPSGRANRAGARAERDRQRAHQRRHGGHHDRPEANQAAFVDRLRRAVLCPSRSRAIAKSTIMMAFFFTMPISMITPTKP